MKARAIFVCLIVCLALSIAALAQGTLSNDSCWVRMAKAGLSDEVIVSMIQSQPGHMRRRPMRSSHSREKAFPTRCWLQWPQKGGGAAPSPAPLAVATSSYDEFDIGVYRKVGNRWIPVASELVNWKTGGVLKSVGTLGVVKGDVNGRNWWSERNAGEIRRFVSHQDVPDGVEATEFQLVHLHEEGDAREFRTVTGGVFHVSGGSSRDRIGFEQTKLASRTYRVMLATNLPKGEYAFLSSGVTGSTASGSTGKAYTCIVE